MTQNNDNELYYWLDPETGELEELIEAEFKSRIEEILQNRYNWENVRV